MHDWLRLPPLCWRAKRALCAACFSDKLERAVTARDMFGDIGVLRGQRSHRSLAWAEHSPIGPGSRCVLMWIDATDNNCPVASNFIFLDAVGWMIYSILDAQRCALTHSCHARTRSCTY